MNLEELRKSMESDATIENKKLKAEVDRLKKQIKKERDEHTNTKSSLLDDCRVLANRCYALTMGTMCCFCELGAYRCPQALSFDQKIAAARTMMEESK